MWYDATSAVGVIEDPQSSKVAGRTPRSYAWAPPSQDGRPSGWLYTWSLADPLHLPAQAGGLGFHRLDDLEVLHQDGGQQAGLVARAAGQPVLQLPDTAVQEALRGLRPADPAVHQRHQLGAPDDQAGCPTPGSSSWTSRSSRTWAPTSVSSSARPSASSQQSVATTLSQAQLYAQAGRRHLPAHPDGPGIGPAAQTKHRILPEAPMTTIAPPVAAARPRARPPRPPPPGVGTPGAAAARAGFHHHRHPAAVRPDAVVLAAVVEPGPARAPSTSSGSPTTWMCSRTASSARPRSTRSS